MDSPAGLEPGLSWSYALTLTDAQKQKVALEKTAKQWLRTDEQTARAQIQASDLPADTITRLLKPQD